MFIPVVNPIKIAIIGCCFKIVNEAAMCRSFSWLMNWIFF